MPVDLDKLQAVFLHAAEIADFAEREVWLNGACAGDAELRQRVDALLAADRSPHPLLNSPAPMVDDDATPLVPEAAPGNLIAGRYKLLEQIGEGGMGLVWMAEQRTPVRRLVAVKLIKAGMDSRSVLTRFEAERQALAMMDHPSIARVFDGGITNQGHPWFAMELVRGLPVTQYSDERRLSVSERLELFVQICSAAQHAHQKGIIHRDLKPTNVLVTEIDGRPLPKVIDFGLAKALGGGAALTERTLYTSFGTVAGTPIYMSPEQVAISAIDVDTRADVYALGVILYELLTGTTPLERPRLKEAAWDEVCRVIREEEPARPSLRISASDALPSLAAARHVDPAMLPSLVRGDLDWIVLKALEKDRNRRYESAAGLAADVQRHLADEPVIAAPPSLRYRARKFLYKHRGPTVAAIAVLLALTLGLIGTAWMGIRYRQASVREAANAASEKNARQAAELESYVASLGAARMFLTSEKFVEARKRLDAAVPSCRGWEWRFMRQWAAAVRLTIPYAVYYSGDSVLSAYPDGTLQWWSDSGATLGKQFKAGIAKPRLLEGSRDRSRFVTVSGNTLKLWDLRGNQVGVDVQVADGFPETRSANTSFSLPWSNNGKWLLTFSQAGTVRVLNVETGDLGPPMNEGRKLDSAKFALGDTRVVTLSDEVVRIWTLLGQLVTEITLTGVNPNWYSVEFAPDGNSLVAMADWSGRLEWLELPAVRKAADAESASPAANTKAKRVIAIEDVHDRKFSPDGTRLATMSVDDRQFRLWNHEGQVLAERHFSHRLTDMDEECNLEFSSDGRLFLLTRDSIEDGYAVHTFDINGKSLNELLQYKHHKIISARFTPDKHGIFVFSGGTMRLWDTGGHSLSEPASFGGIEGDDGEVPRVRIAFNADDTMLCTSTESKPQTDAIRFWNVNGKPVTSVIELTGDASTGSLHSLTGFSPKGGYFYVMPQVAQNVIRLWNKKGAPTGTPMRNMSTFGKREGLFSPNERWFYTRTSLVGYRIWALAEQSTMATVRCPNQENESLAFNSDESMCLTSGNDLFDVQGRRLGQWNYGLLGDGGVEFCDDGRHLRVVSGKKDTVHLIPIDAYGGPVERYVDKDEAEYMLATTLAEPPPETAAPSARKLDVRIDERGSLQIIGNSSHQSARRLGDRDLRAVCFAATHDESRVAAACDDRTIRFFDAQLLRELAIFEVPDNVKKLQFTPADTRLIVTFADQSFEIWDTRDHAVRQADRDARWSEQQAARMWAQQYVDKLIAKLMNRDNWKSSLDADKSLTPVQRFVAVEILQNRLDDASAVETWAKLTAQSKSPSSTTSP